MPIHMKLQVFSATITRGSKHYHRKISEQTIRDSYVHFVNEQGQSTVSILLPTREFAIAVILCVISSFLKSTQNYPSHDTAHTKSFSTSLWSIIIFRFTSFEVICSVSLQKNIEYIGRSNKRVILCQINQICNYDWHAWLRFKWNLANLLGHIRHAK